MRQAFGKEEREYNVLRRFERRLGDWETPEDLWEVRTGIPVITGRVSPRELCLLRSEEIGKFFTKLSKAREL